MTLFKLLVLFSVLCFLAGCPQPGVGPPKKGGSTSSHPYLLENFPKWPEARQWLKSSKNAAALASNRFDSTQKAVEFVERLYNAGAVRVAVFPDTIMSDQMTLQEEGGPYADTIAVELPRDPSRRAQVMAICQIEFSREGTNDAEAVSGDYVCLFWD